MKEYKDCFPKIRGGNNTNVRLREDPISLVKGVKILESILSTISFIICHNQFVFMRNILTMGSILIVNQIVNYNLRKMEQWL